MAEQKRKYAGKIIIRSDNWAERYLNKDTFPVAISRIFTDDKYGKNLIGRIFEPGILNSQGEPITDLLDPPDLIKIMMNYEKIDYEITNNVWKAVIQASHAMKKIKPE